MTERAFTASLPEIHRSVVVAPGVGARKILAFMGPGYLVAVGYMDPGNWATSIGAGSAFGYTLLCVAVASCLMAMLFQSLCARLGLAAGLDLAQACRLHYKPRSAFTLWVMAEVAVVATDLAELIGAAIALKLLFGLPLVAGVLIMALDVFLILLLLDRSVRAVEALVASLIAIIALSFIYNLALAQPDIAALARGLMPKLEIVTDPTMLLLSMGIIGATVMPHNLYLHSALVQTRRHHRSPSGTREAIRFATLDSCIALLIALGINCAILILAASTFHAAGRTNVVEIEQAYELLTPMLGGAAAGFAFALALLASGLASTVTATLAGQTIMEGFLQIRLPAWIRRLGTRAIAIVPAIAVTIAYGESGTASLLVFSQVVLSMQLPFALVPLVRFASSRELLGEHAAPRLLVTAAWLCTGLVIVLNLAMLVMALTFK